MSAEFDNSSEYQRPKLEALPTFVLRDMAKESTGQQLLHHIQFVATERGLRSDADAAKLAIEIEEKRQILIDQARNNLNELITNPHQDISKADLENDFAWFMADFYTAYGPELGDDEEARIALFKRPK